MSTDKLTPSPKICPTCKREKCELVGCPTSHDLGRHYLRQDVCHNSCPPAEKEADEMRVAEEIVRKYGYKKPYGEPLIKATATALHEAKARGRREAKRAFIKAIQENHATIGNEAMQGLNAAIDTIKD